jgi:hypothetical protein
MHYLAEKAKVFHVEHYVSMKIALQSALPSDYRCLIFSAGFITL